MIKKKRKNYNHSANKLVCIFIKKRIFEYFFQIHKHVGRFMKINVGRKKLSKTKKRAARLLGTLE